MLIGCHVSPAGGVYNAVSRGVERGASAVQIFNQSPRMWRPTVYKDEDVIRYHELLADSDVKALMIHAVYLLNAGTDDAEIRAKTVTSLTASLRAGDRLGAHSVVLHPGSAKTGNVAEAVARAGAVIREALAESDGCPLHLENTAGAGGTLGRSFDELAALIEAAGGDERLGLCLDSCHLYASGHDIRTAEGLSATLDECDAKVGLGRLGSLHLNDSQVGLGSNRDRHADIGQGELGLDGCAVFLSEPRFESLPVILETPGPDKKGTPPEEIALCRELREQGLAARGS
ncbi:MAG: deoxyribonuclease [Solirubrobacterales bacterium]|nr:deoxyribonuclease [Solirubrobacterales bacterium]